MTTNPNEVSANIQMRISNEVTFSGVAWEPLALQKQWLLASGPMGSYRVYIQFRDGAGNESFVTSDSIEYVPVLYAPLIRK